MYVDPYHPDHVYRLKKVLDGLKQPHVHGTGVLLEQGYSRGGADKTLFIKKVKYDLIIAQIYIDIMCSVQCPNTWWTSL